MKKHIENLRSIAKRAWSLVKQLGYSLSEAFKLAWHEIKTAGKPTVSEMESLVTALKDGVVWLTFRKIDGTITDRRATLCHSLVPAEYQSTITGRTVSEITDFVLIQENNLKFYEVFEGWKSCKSANIIGWCKFS